MSELIQQAFAKETLLACKGYNPLFVDAAVPIKVDAILPKEYKALLPTVEGNNKGILHYTALSVWYNSKRRVPFVSAYNIDGSVKKDGIKRASSFRTDPRIDESLQLTQEGFYDLRKDITEFEIGHMAANNEMAWGGEAQLQSYQTFHFPNSVPQAEKLNTGIWKSLEAYIIDEAGSAGSKRINVFTGPVINTKDPAYRWQPTFKIPLLFYKVVVFQSGGKVYCTAFLMSHEQKMIEQEMFVVPSTLRIKKATETVPEFADFKYRKVFQISMPLLKELTGLTFSWKNVTAIPVPNDKNQVIKIRRIKDSKDAEEANKLLRKGIAPQALALHTDLSSTEIKNKNFKLNLILP